MARNPYTVLGVSPSASDSDIRAAFRKLAKEHHPDRNPGDKAAEDKFKEISGAFDILGDSERRKKFDRGEIDAEGRERAGAYSYREWRSQDPRGGKRGKAGQGFGDGFRGGFDGAENMDPGGDFADLSDIFADLFGSRPRDGRQQGFRGPGGGRGGQDAPRGRDLRYRLEVTFLDAARGGTKRVTMPDGRSLDINIPSGLEDGQTLRLRGQGEAAPPGGEAGDVYVEAIVKAHELFQRDGLDIHVEAPVSLTEAVLGGRITVPTIEGDVAVTVPKNSNSGTVLRLKGRGVKPGKGGDAGDQYVKLKIVLPEGGDPDLEAFVKSWKRGADHAPRRHFAGV